MKNILLLFLVSLFFISCSNKQEEIKIGSILALTGKAATYGNWAKKGITLATEQLNARSKNNIQFKVLFEDSQGDPKFAVSSMENLLSVNQVPVIIGFITSGEFLASAPLAEKRKTVIITPVAGAPLIREDGSFVFRTRENGTAQSKIVAEYMVNQLKIKNASIVFENAANAIAYKDVFNNTFSSIGGQIIQQLGYNEGQTDFRSILLEIKKKQVESVYIAGVGKIIARILIQAKELGIKSRIFSDAGIEDPELFKIAGNISDNIIFGAPAFSLNNNDSTTSNFIKAYQKRFNEDPSVYAANAYDAMMVIAKAVKSGSRTPNQIKNYLYNILNYDGASGNFTFEKNGEVKKSVILKIIKNQQFLPLK